MSHSKSTKSPRVNVLSKYQGMMAEEIKASIIRYPVALGCFSVRYDINAGVMIRNSNAFACSHFLMVGEKKYDRRPSLGCQNYENIVCLKDIEALRKWLQVEKYALVGVDYIPNKSTPIGSIINYPTRPLFLMGSERSGLPSEVIDMCDMIVHITQFGSVRSLNVGVASGILLNDWHNKNG